MGACRRPISDSGLKQRRPPFWVWNAGLKQLYMSSFHLAPDLSPITWMPCGITVFNIFKATPRRYTHWLRRLYGLVAPI